VFRSICNSNHNNDDKEVEHYITKTRMQIWQHAIVSTNTD